MAILKLPELLAPAGGPDQLRAALRFGADAVYGGMKQYGLRAFAGNFDQAALREAVALTHAQGKKFYVTMNAYPFDDQLEGFVDAAREACRAGVDAAIVSDLGAVCALRKSVPELKIHISTQANALNTPTARHYYELGAERVILAREVSIARMRAMRRALPEALQLEVFVHGAACMSYSGRCLLSNALTGRGSNQGACAQPCRWHYAVVEEKRPGQYMPVAEDENGTYIFSAQDLNLMPLLPELVSAGVSSLKIEGRMKTEYYVATVTAAYRRGLDALAAGDFEAQLPALMRELSMASHRESNTGFAVERPAVCGGAPGVTQAAEYVGRVARGAEAGEPASVVLKNRFFVGDTLEVLTPGGVFAYPVTEIVLEETGERVTTYSIAGARLAMRFPFPVSEGDLVRGRVRNNVPSQG